MRELLTLSIGGFGNRVGAQFIEQLMQEHKIDKQGVLMDENILQNLDIYFKESQDSQYIPRAIFTDINSDNDPIRLPIDANNIINCNGKQSNNFADVYFGVGSEMKSLILDSIRDEIENCDSFQGFQYISSLSGGCGSGLSTLLSESLSDEYPSCVQQHYNLIHQPNNSEIVVSPYNNLIALSKIAGLGEKHQIICYDNTSLHGLCLKRVQQKQPLYEDLNQLITMSMLGSTTGFRYPSDQNTDLRKMILNLMPFASLNFLVPSISAFELDYSFQFLKHNAKNLINKLFDAEFSLCFVTPTRGKYFANQINFRGDIQQLEVNKYFHKHLFKNKRYYFEWLPDCATFSVNHQRLQNQNMSATMLSNTSSIIGPLQIIEEQAETMLKKKAFTYLFELQGLSLTEMTICQTNLKDIISIYQDFQDTQPDGEGEGFE